MKKTVRLFSVLLSLIALLSLGFSACQRVTPAAWVELRAGDGYVVYTSDMYGITRAHIYCYDDDSTEKTAIEITFIPRILGSDTVDGVKTTLVDVSGAYEMTVIVYKGSSLYSAEKDFYLNDVKLTPYPSASYDGESIISLNFRDFTLVRGNPNGKLNGVINVIEYK